MNAVPLHLTQANAFIKEHHRHNAPPVSGKFAVGAEQNGKVVGVAVAGRPVARLLDNGTTLEILRACTDGTPNAGSFLYARVKRIAQLMGYQRIITYTLKRESGSTLRAIGARVSGLAKAKTWNVPSRPRREQAVYREDKLRWDLQERRDFGPECERSGEEFGSHA